MVLFKVTGERFMSYYPYQIRANCIIYHANKRTVHLLLYGFLVRCQVILVVRILIIERKQLGHCCVYLITSNGLSGNMIQEQIDQMLQCREILYGIIQVINNNSLFAYRSAYNLPCNSLCCYIWYEHNIQLLSIYKIVSVLVCSRCLESLYFMQIFEPFKRLASFPIL